MDHIVFGEFDAYLYLFLDILRVVAGVVAQLSLEDVPVEDVLAAVREVIVMRELAVVVEDVVATVVVEDIWTVIVFEDVVAAIEDVIVATRGSWSIVVAVIKDIAAIGV